MSCSWCPDSAPFFWACVAFQLLCSRCPDSGSFFWACVAFHLLCRFFWAHFAFQHVSVQPPRLQGNLFGNWFPTCFWPAFPNCCETYFRNWFPAGFPPLRTSGKLGDCFPAVFWQAPRTAGKSIREIGLQQISGQPPEARFGIARVGYLAW